MQLLHTLPQQGFRIERPLPASDGSWVVDGWTAWTFLEGTSATPADAAAVAQATQALHATLATVPNAPHLQANAGLADCIAWDDDPLPLVLPREIDAPVRQLAQLRTPVEGLQEQVIHGDLNYHNILAIVGDQILGMGVDEGVARLHPRTRLQISPHFRLDGLIR